MTEQQVDIINRWAWVLSPCVEFAGRYLQLPKVEIVFADCPSNLFPTMSNAAEGTLLPNGVGRVLFNGPWFAERICEHRDDVEFFLFHELRHLHQFGQMNILRSKGKTREPKETVEAWQRGFDGYVRNDGESTETANVTQEVEVDANAYGLLLSTLYRGGKFPIVSIPDEAFFPARDRVQKYYDTLPEFRTKKA